VAAAGAAGYTYTVLWDVDPFDWQQPGAGVIVSRVLGTVRPGSVILLHTTGQTAQALPSIIQGLRSRGLQPVRLHELFASGLR
jgi:peptidoglycan/xylan/chitin deacetylase (PgdA/CDA1 family)